MPGISRRNTIGEVEKRKDICYNNRQVYLSLTSVGISFQERGFLTCK